MKKIHNTSHSIESTTNNTHVNRTKHVLFYLNYQKGLSDLKFIYEHDENSLKLYKNKLKGSGPWTCIHKIYLRIHNMRTPYFLSKWISKQLKY